MWQRGHKAGIVRDFSEHGKLWEFCATSVAWPWPLIGHYMTFTFWCDNLWKSIFAALEKPGKTPNFSSTLCAQLWPGGVVVRVLACDTKGRGFDSQPFRFQVTTLGKLFTCTCASVTKQYNFVLVKGRWCPAAGKVTVGLASHWPCVTDFSGLSTYGLTA